MNEQDVPPSTETKRGVCVALIYALVAERLSVYYEHDLWMTRAQGATLATNWLSRSKRIMSMDLRKNLSDLSDQLARQIAATISREAGLYLTHEMQESLDTRYQSEIGQSIMVECERIFDEALPE
ncbi:MAG: hypothetical protein Q7J20_12845 [Candidatus Nitrotoga sp.]|nr:hypothetical protein [Candidatus Nitrotoga sp.]MDO9448753.1 hypothetical protein [Candidatus Nitrotoga sp.]MDP3496089.1 hypothetical protein [Candidatus Nitrotoga sp.]